MLHPGFWKEKSGCQVTTERIYWVGAEMNFKLNACDCLFNLQVLKVIDAVLVLFSHLKIEIEYCSWLFFKYLL